MGRVSGLQAAWGGGPEPQGRGLRARQPPPSGPQPLPQPAPLGIRLHIFQGFPALWLFLRGLDGLAGSGALAQLPPSGPCFPITPTFHITAAHTQECRGLLPTAALFRALPAGRDPTEYPMRQRRPELGRGALSQARLWSHSGWECPTPLEDRGAKTRFPDAPGCSGPPTPPQLQPLAGRAGPGGGKEGAGRAARPALGMGPPSPKQLGPRSTGRGEGAQLAGGAGPER